MRSGAGHSGTVNFEPDSAKERGTTQSGDPSFEGRPFVRSGVRQKIALTNDFQQPGERYRSLSKNNQDPLVDKYR